MTDPILDVTAPGVAEDSSGLGLERSGDAGSAGNGSDPPVLAAPRADAAGPTTLVKLRGLPWSMAGDSLNSIFAQFTVFGSVFVLFLNTLGLSKSEIGVVLSLLPFTSVFALFIAPAVSKFGYKRTFLTAYGARLIVTSSLLLTPWVVATYGSQAALRFVAVIVALFATMRALMEIGHMPWVQEYVPNAVRGKYAAKDNMYVTLAGIFAITVAGVVIGRASGLTGYMALIAAGVLVGFVALWCFSFIPGGAAVRASGAFATQYRELREALRDRDYRRYLLGVSLVTLGVTMWVAFLPLYLQEQIGIDTGRVVWVQIGTLVGGLLSSYLWGWAADRYGSKPVMRSGAAVLAVLPVLLWLIPRDSVLSLYVALGVALVQGVAGVGWVIGAGRLLHVTLVPPVKKVGYMALYAAWVGIVAGLSQLAGGRILDMTQGISAQAGYFVLDPYTPLFLIGIILTAASQPVLRGIRAEMSVGVMEFAGLFFHGNPFMAMTSLIRNQLAKDERSSVLRTEQLGRAHSRLTVEELVDALVDPRYNVRYEAEIAISRMRRDPRLTQAMVGMLEGTELALSAQAAWALGRMGDKDAIEPLREAMDNPYRSVRMQSIRALGWLGDTESIPVLLERLHDETDRGLQMAYVSALGNLGAKEATEAILALLREMENPGARLEIALALARLAGKDHLFIRLLRQMRRDPGTAAAQALSELKKRVRPKRKRETPDSEITRTLDECMEAFAAEDLNQGAALLSRILYTLPADAFDACPRIILVGCADQLAEHDADRVETIVLALHTLNVAWRP